MQEAPYGWRHGIFYAKRNIRGMSAKHSSKQRFRRTYIKDWREHRGMSLEELGARISMSAANLSRIECGYQPYKQDFLELIANELNCSVVDLIARPPGAPADSALQRSIERLPASAKQKILDLIAIIATDDAA